MGRSVAWVSQVERGVRRIDRMSVLESLASALDIPLAELAAEAPVVAAVTEESPAAGGLRLVLSRGDSPRAMPNSPHSPRPPHPRGPPPQARGLAPPRPDARPAHPLPP